MKKTLLIALTFAASSSFAQTIQANLLGRYTDGRDGACEISAYDAESQQIYVTNAVADSIDIVDISDATNPTKVGQIDVLTYGGGVNSVVALGNGFIAAAIEDDNKQNDGVVVFYDTSGTFVAEVTVGALPDMLTVTHDGNTVIVANEGEPSDDYLTDPEGSVSVIDISGGVSGITQNDVTEITFKNDSSDISGGLRKPGTTWNIDLEPEYITVAGDDSKAFVICQEANVLVVIDLSDNSVAGYVGLGFKDHSTAGNQLDPSNRDNGINIASWDVHGVYQPDAIASYEVGGNTYIVTANEGDGRDYAGYSSETRIKDLMLDSTVFTNYAFLQEDSNLGRLKTFTPDVIGDSDGDGYVDELYSYGARSFSIWDDGGNLVYDSGDEIENYIKDNHETFFNCNDGLASEFDDRSDDKGPEPEAVTIGRLRNTYFAFVGLERQGGVMVYNITDPMNPVFDTYIEELDEVNGTMDDIAPEGLVFVHKDDSHNGMHMLIVSNEVSGTTTIYEIVDNYEGIEEATNESAFKMYPNPTSDVVRIEFSNDFEAGQFIVTNSLGSIVERGFINANNQELDLSNLPNGIYNVTILNNNEAKISSQKLVKR